MARSATTKIHVTALDGIVNVNSLFTLALFVGLAKPLSSSSALIADASSLAGSATAEDFVVFHFYAFAFFLFSSLIALALKQAITLSDKTAAGTPNTSNFASLIADLVGTGYYESLVHINLKALKVGTLVSGLGSIMGCGFLTMALVNLVQIKLGVLSCGGLYTLSTVAPLVTLVPLASFIYVFFLLHAFTR